MIYATRRDGDHQTLIELPSEKYLKTNMRYVRSSIAHKWVKDGKPHETGLFVDDEGKVRYALAGKATVPETERHWRCFHCDEVFTTEHTARLHFGETECQSPACQIKAGAEMSMLEALRRAEEEARKAVIAMHEEGTDGWTAFRRLEGRTKQNAEAAENLGYERGLRDGRAEAATLYGPYAHLNGHRALSEDSWTVEDDPIGNDVEYFSIPLFAKVDVKFPVTHGEPDVPAYEAYADELRALATNPKGVSE